MGANKDNSTVIIIWHNESILQNEEFFEILSKDSTKKYQCNAKVLVNKLKLNRIINID